MYEIIRLYQDSNHKDHHKIIKRNLTLEQAQEHCKDDSTHELGVWFDGYQSMKKQNKKPGLLETACQILAMEKRNK